MSSPSSIASTLIEIITRAPGQQALGTRLADQLRSLSDYNPDVHGRFGSFVKNHVPNVKRLGRRGGDWYYGLTQDAEVPQESKRQSEIIANIISTSAWKTYTSPSTRYRLMANPQTGELSVVAPGRALLQSPWILIQPCSSAHHTEIAREFVETLTDESHRQRLEEILGKHGSGPASGFYSAVRDLGLSRAWAEFRHSKIADALLDSLRSAGVEFTRIIDADHSRRTQKSETPATWVGVETTNAIPINAEPATSRFTDPKSQALANLTIQNIAAAAVAKMSEAELRNLSIPLGYIIDVITAS